MPVMYESGKPSSPEYALARTPHEFAVKKAKNYFERNFNTTLDSPKLGEKLVGVAKSYMAPLAYFGFLAKAGEHKREVDYSEFESLIDKL